MHLFLRIILSLLSIAQLGACFTYLQCNAYFGGQKSNDITNLATRDACAMLSGSFPDGVVRQFGAGGGRCCQARSTSDDKAITLFDQACQGLSKTKPGPKYQWGYCPGSCGKGC